VYLKGRAAVRDELQARELQKEVVNLKKEMERFKLRAETRRVLFGHLAATEIVEIAEKLKKQVMELEILLASVMEEESNAYD
jgi:ACT domain-containing protein